VFMQYVQIKADAWPGEQHVGNEYYNGQVGGTPIAAWSQGPADAWSQPPMPMPPAYPRNPAYGNGFNGGVEPLMLNPRPQTGSTMRPTTAPSTARSRPVSASFPIHSHGRPQSKAGSTIGGDSVLGSFDQDGEPRKEDPFSVAIQHAAAEHQSIVEQLTKENQSLKKQLNSVLQATWSMGEDGLAGDGDDDIPALKLLSMEMFDSKRQVVGHDVPDDFVNEQRAAGIAASRANMPIFFDTRERWSQSKSKLANLSKLNDSSNTDDNPDGGPQRPDNRPLSRSMTAQIAMTRKSQSGSTIDGFEETSSVLIHPASNRLIVWDLFGMSLLAYDLVMVPIGAFNPEENGFMEAMEWVTLIFWSFDMIVSCFTGYVEQGQTVMDHLQILKHYARSWLLLDIIIVVPDWIFTLLKVLAGSSDGSNATRLLRAFRLARGLRLLRIAKIRRISQYAKDYIESEFVFKVFNIMTIVAFLSFFNHLLGALWYALGDAISPDEPNWIRTQRLADKTIDYRYLTSLEWSVSHFTLGHTGIQPQNSYERVFATGMLIMGMVFFTGFTSYITIAMLSLRDQKSASSTELWLLRKFLRQNKITRGLSYRVLRYAEFSSQNGKNELLSEDSVLLISYLSDGLRSELRFEASFSSFLRHPLIEQAVLISRGGVHALAEGALSHKSFAANDIIFRDGNKGTSMYVVESGEINYQHKVQGLGSRKELAEGDWACEQSLWVAWTTQGTLSSRTNSTMICCEPISLGEVVNDDPELLALMGLYAKRFTDWLNGVGVQPDNLTDVFIGAVVREQAATFLQEAAAMIEQHTGKNNGGQKKRISSLMS